MRRRKTRSFLYGVFLAMLCVTPGITAQAGGINGDEASIVAAASGTFTYNGKTYRAGSAYINSLESYLAQDDVDLNAGQASSAISQMYASVQQGVEQGYLYEVGGSESGDTAGQTPEGESTEGGNTAGQPTTRESNDATEQNGTQEVKNETSEASGNGNAVGNPEEDGTEQEASDTTIQLDKNADAPEESSKEVDYTKTVEELFEDSKELSKEETKGAMVKMTIILAILLILSLMIWLVMVFLRKKKAKPIVTAIMEKGLTDVHCHILPAVDDGSQDMETSLKMVETGYQSGIRKMIVTPHYIKNRLRYDSKKLERVFESFKEEVKKVHPDMECYLGNELYFDEQVLEDVKEGKVHTMADSKYLLVEFSVKITYHDLYRAMKKAVQARYFPVLAHVERYQCLVNQPERIAELAELGVYFQMNADSVIKKEASGCRNWCRKLMKEERIQFLGTDAHGTTHRTTEMRKAVKWICEHVDASVAEDLLIHNPTKMLENKYLD